MRKDPNSNYTYYLETTTMTKFKTVLLYLDHFNLISKHIQYIKCRSVYLNVLNKKHLTSDGLEKIIKVKNNLNK
jgi:neutral trehalase